jgi:hypothetical protein
LVAVVAAVAVPTNDVAVIDPPTVRLPTADVAPGVNVNALCANNVAFEAVLAPTNVMNLVPEVAVSGVMAINVAVEALPESAPVKDVAVMVPTMAKFPAVELVGV